MKRRCWWRTRAERREEMAAQTPAETLPRREDGGGESQLVVLTVDKGEDDEDQDAHHDTKTSTPYLDLHPPSSPGGSDS